MLSIIKVKELSKPPYKTKQNKTKRLSPSLQTKDQWGWHLSSKLATPNQLVPLDLNWKHLFQSHFKTTDFVPALCTPLTQM